MYEEVAVIAGVAVSGRAKEYENLAHEGAAFLRGIVLTAEAPVFVVETWGMTLPVDVRREKTTPFVPFQATYISALFIEPPTPNPVHLLSVHVPFLRYIPFE